jgi:hypothetical protein
LLWDIIDELRLRDARIEEGTIMGGRCARIAGEFLGLVDYKCSGMVIKLPPHRVDELNNNGIGQPLALAGKVFREWVAIKKPDRRRWTKLLHEAITFVAPPKDITIKSKSAGWRRMLAQRGGVPAQGRTTVAGVSRSVRPAR